MFKARIRNIIDTNGRICKKGISLFLQKKQDQYLFLEKRSARYVCATFGIKLSSLTNQTIYLVLQ